MLAINYSWLHYSALTIDKRNNLFVEDSFRDQSIDYDFPWPGVWTFDMVKENHKNALVNHIQISDNKKFYLTKKVTELINEVEIKKIKNITNNRQIGTMNFK